MTVSGSSVNKKQSFAPGLRQLTSGSSDGGSLLRLLIVFVVLVAIGAVISHGVLLRPENLSNILQQNAVLLVVVISQFIVIVTGGFDLSVGAVVALSSVMFVGSLDYGVPIAVLISLATGAIFGLANGILVTFAKLPSFVVTLGTMQIGYSLAKVWTGGGTLDSAPGGAAIPKILTSFYITNFADIPLPVWLAVAVFGLAGVYLKTSIGHFIYAVGGNSNAARLAGIPVSRARLVAYTVASLVASVSGLLFAMRVGYGDPQAGVLLPLDSIAAVSIGGVSLTGGRGHLLAGFIGVLIIAMLDNLMNLLGVSVFLQPVVKGAIVIVTVFIYSRR